MGRATRSGMPRRYALALVTLYFAASVTAVPPIANVDTKLPGRIDLRFDAGTPLTKDDKTDLVGEWRMLTLADDSLIAINPRAGKIFKFHQSGKADKLFSMRAPAGAQLCITNYEGKLLLAVRVTNTTQRILRLNQDGSIDDSFFEQTFEVPWQIQAMSLQKNGDILVGGYFLDGVMLLRLSSSGLPDPAFRVTGCTGERTCFVQFIQVQSDDEILISGIFDEVNGVPRNRIARLHSNGVLDSTYDPGANMQLTRDRPIFALFVDPLDRLYVSGNFSAVEDQTPEGIVRLLKSGALDRTFAPKFGPLPSLTFWEFRGINVDYSNNLLLAGIPNSFRLKGDVVDPTFQVNGDLSKIAERTDGRIHATVISPGSWPGKVNGMYSYGPVQLLPNGVRDSSFNPPGPNGLVQRIKPLPSGEIVISGRFGPKEGFHSFQRNNVAILQPDGSLDTNSNLSFHAVYDMDVDTNGYLFAIAQEQRNSEIGLIRANLKGPLETITLTPATPYTYSLSCLVLRSGKVLATGVYTNSGVSGLVRFNSDLSVDPTWNAQVVGGRIEPNRLLEAPDGSIYAAQPGSVIRLHENGDQDTTFNSPTWLRFSPWGPAFNDGGLLSALALDHEGRLLVAGDFDRVGGKVASALVRLNRDGSLDQTFHPGFFGSGNDLLVRRGGGILLATGNTVVNIGPGRWQPPVANGLISALTQSAEGGVYVGGQFTTVNQIAAASIARVWSDNSLLELTITPGMDSHPATIRLSGEQGIAVSLETSPDLQSWSTFQTISNFTGSYTIPQDVRASNLFFRARKDAIGDAPSVPAENLSPH